MDIEKIKSSLGIIFYVGIGLGALVSFSIRYSFLPSFYNGFLAGVAACFILGGGTLKHILKDGADKKHAEA